MTNLEALQQATTIRVRPSGKLVEAIASGCSIPLNTGDVHAAAQELKRQFPQAKVTIDLGFTAFMR